jgi:hypothetical protein
MYTYLSQHPDVFFPAVKEPHFFTQVRPAHGRQFLYEAVSSRSKYLRLYSRAAGRRAIGDASPSYLWHPEVPERIRAAVPRANIIVVLRDPVERAYSHYLMDYREGAQHDSFFEALVEDIRRSNKGWGVSHLYYELGLYAEQIERYFNSFGREQVKVLIFEDFCKSTGVVLREVARFLFIDPGPLETIDMSRKYNAYAAPRNHYLRRVAGARFSRLVGQAFIPDSLGAWIFQRFFLKRGPKPPLDPRAREFLSSLYAPEMDKLERLLARRLPQLRHSWS